MSLLSTETIIQQTRQWLSTVVIHYGLCPFVKNEFLNERIHYSVIKQKSITEQLEAMIMECVNLDNQASIETSLLIYPESLSNFDHYLDFYYLADELLEKQNYRGIYQLASFHPQYCFADTDKDDASNYTNRSPYPMLHILRESSVERALVNYPNPENIPDKNISLTHDLGVTRLKSLLEMCTKS